MAIFSARDGLATTLERIVVDSKGFVWLPGCEGLARFDGNGFRIFTPADGLPGNCALDIFERRDGTYWVAAPDHLCIFDPRPNRKRFQCESPKVGTISTVLENERGLWCGTDTGLWFRPANGAKPGEFIRAIEPSTTGRSIAVRRLLRDTRGDVWAATYSGLFRFRLNGRIDRWTRAEGLAADLVTAISETPGAIWAGSTQGELMRFRIDPDTGEARITDRYERSHGLPSAHISDVHFWQGEVWAATRQGLARQLPSGRWEAVRLDPSVSGLPFESLATDHLGNLWVGTDGAGAARISGLGISSFSEEDGLGVRKVWAVFEDRKGDLVAVTKDEDHYFLNRFDGYRFHAIRPNAPFGIAWGWSWSQIAVHSRSGDWWLATGAGLLRYANHLRVAPSLQGPEVGLRSGNLFRVFEDSSGAIWASFQEFSKSSLYRRDPATGRFESLDESHGLPSLRQLWNYPSAFAEDGSHQVWIGMLDRGLVRFRNGKFEQFSSSSGAPDQGVRALLVDRQGRLWIGSRRRGLLRVDDPSAAHPVFRAYTKSSGLSSITVAALAEDLAGRIYAASGSGVDRLDPATDRIRHFTTADGLLPGEIRVAFRDRHGALWFGGDQGLIRIEPREERREPPMVVVYSIRVNGASKPLSDLGDSEPAALSLSPSERELQVDFGGFRHDLLYQTHLSGVDPDWTPPSTTRAVHYLSLAPGSYELSIRAVTPEGSVSPRPAQVRFRIAAPVWRRWWFLLMSFAALGAIAYAAHRYHLRQEVALERMRTRIATDLHDDIGASLSRIAILSEVCKRQVDGGRDAVPLLAEIADSARSLVDSMRDIVWAIDPRYAGLADVVHRVREFAPRVLEARAIQWDFRVQSGIETIRLDPEERRHLLLFFKEAVNNAVRHAECHSVSLALATEGRLLVAEVRDDGRGLAGPPPGTAAATGQGLRNMETRAAQLHGRFMIASGEGEGMRLRLEIPVRS